MNRHELNYLYVEFKKINLVEFIEKEAGVSFTTSGDNRYCCLCPMPFHKDSQPSFHVFKSTSGGFGDCWVYHCFGCGSGGTIIDFCMNYLSLDYPSDAMIFLAEKLEIKETYEVVTKAIKEARIDSNLKKKIDSEHFLASKRCYQLMKKYNDDEIKSWVFNTYKNMNEMLSKEDIKGIELVSKNALNIYKSGKEAISSINYASI